MITPRYAPALCALMALALLPTIIHSYAGMTVADDRKTAGIPTTLAGYTATRTGRDSRWGQRRFDSHDWFERRYVSATGEVVLTVLRSYDLKRLYHHPELDVAYGVSFRDHEVRRVPQNPAIPVHVLTSRAERGPIALYVLHYGDTFVDNPLAFQIRTAGELLFRGRKAMTLFFALETAARDDVAPEQRPSAKLLVAAIDRFLAR